MKWPLKRSSSALGLGESQGNLLQAWLPQIMQGDLLLA